MAYYKHIHSSWLISLIKKTADRMSRLGVIHLLSCKSKPEMIQENANTVSHSALMSKFLEELP